MHGMHKWLVHGTKPCSRWRRKEPSYGGDRPRALWRQTGIGSAKRARQVHLQFGETFAARHLPLHRSSDFLASNVPKSFGGLFTCLPQRELGAAGQRTVTTCFGARAKKRHGSHEGYTSQYQKQLTNATGSL